MSQKQSTQILSGLLDIISTMCNNNIEFLNKICSSILSLMTAVNIE